MTLEQRLTVALGDKDFAIAVLQTQLEQAMQKIADFEKAAKAKDEGADIQGDGAL